MLAARGVSLGLGKINLSELNQLPAPNRVLLNRVERQKRRERELERLRHKLVVRKHVDRQTLWAACRAVVIGTIVIVLGLAMTVLGYFDRDLTTTVIRNGTLGTTIYVVDDVLRYNLKSMQYIGPIFMGVGTFLLIIACVITLESRDRHAQIIQNKSAEYNALRRQSKLPVTRSTVCGGSGLNVAPDTQKTPQSAQLFFHTAQDTASALRRQSERAAPLVQADSTLELSAASTPAAPRRV